MTAAGPLLAAVLAASPAPAPVAPAPAAAAGPCVYDGRTGQPASLDAALDRAARSQVVYAGEKHDDAAHHALQARLIERLRAAAGFEMLYASRQDALTRYVSGAEDAASFQAEVDWRRTWGFPFSLYEPVFDAVRAGSRTAFALNVDKRVVDKVALSGLESLSSRERAEVPADFQATADPAYLAMLRETFKAHGGDPSEPVAFGRFVDAMSLWNEGMAFHLAEAVHAAGGVPVVVAAGAFHAFDAGIPASLARRVPGVRQTSFVFQTEAACPARLAPDALTLGSDYVWVVTGR